MKPECTDCENKMWNAINYKYFCSLSGEYCPCRACPLDFLLTGYCDR